LKVKILVSLCLIFLVLAAGCQSGNVTKLTPVSFPPDAKVVCIFFDDGYTDQYNVALPILLQYGFKATFGIITSCISEDGEDNSLYMSQEQLTQLANDGMNIASHTVTHPHLPTLTDDQERDEIFRSKETLESMGFVVDTLVYPYYEWDNRAIKYAQEAGYICARAGWPEEGPIKLSSITTKGRFHLSSQQIWDQDLKAFQAFVDKAGPDSVVCIVYHHISDVEASTADVEMTNTPISNFQEQMAYLKNAGFTVVAVDDLFK
jgi:hypothetical protein